MIFEVTMNDIFFKKICEPKLDKYKENHIKEYKYYKEINIIKTQWQRKHYVTS